MTLSRFQGDTTFTLSVRITSTFFGALIGFFMWSEHLRLPFFGVIELIDWPRNRYIFASLIHKIRMGWQPFVPYAFRSFSMPDCTGHPYTTQFCILCLNQPSLFIPQATLTMYVAKPSGIPIKMHNFNLPGNSGYGWSVASVCTISLLSRFLQISDGKVLEAHSHLLMIDPAPHLLRKYLPLWKPIILHTDRSLVWPSLHRSEADIEAHCGDTPSKRQWLALRPYIRGGAR